MSDRTHDWTEEFASAVTVCDEHGVIVAMNRAAGETFKDEGGRSLIGKSMLDCHPEPSRSLVADLLARPRPNTYTVEKNGAKKLIHQAPWYNGGKFAGLVELSIVLPADMAHHVRKQT